MEWREKRKEITQRKNAGRMRQDQIMERSKCSINNRMEITQKREGTIEWKEKMEGVSIFRFRKNKDRLNNKAEMYRQESHAFKGKIKWKEANAGSIK
jgi:hypothetical protein